MPRLARPTAALSAGRLLDLLFPPHCVACGHLGAWFCDACTARIPGHGHLSAVPLRQSAGHSGLAGAWALSAHGHPLREAVHGLKYGGLRVLAGPLGTLLASGWCARGIAVDVVVPVPLHRIHERRRGYNQAALLAEALAERAGLPCDTRAVERTRATRSQVGLTSDERRVNVQGAFGCVAPGLTGKRVLLVDDVLTTGATMSACAHALVEAGAAAVWGLSLTCALLGPPPQGNAPLP